MSRSQDLVGIANGDVRVSVGDLSISKRIRLFNFLARVVRKHYKGLAGGSSFIPWHTENFGEKLTDHSIRRNSLVVDESFYPKHENYNTKTRIVALTRNYFRLPEFKLPENGVWNLKEMKLVTRICLAQNGDLYLEWYQGRISEMEGGYRHLPRRVLVEQVNYANIPFDTDIDSAPSELILLLQKAPEIINSFGYACMHLLKNEEEARRKRADRDAKAFAEIANIGRIFGITHP